MEIGARMRAPGATVLGRRHPGQTTGARSHMILATRRRAPRETLHWATPAEALNAFLTAQPTTG